MHQVIVGIQHAVVHVRGVEAVVEEQQLAGRLVHHPPVGDQIAGLGQRNAVEELLEALDQIIPGMEPAAAKTP
mgnify:CR=1 FL=1